MTGFDFRSIKKAPKGAAKGKCLPAPKLAYELGIATLRLSLDPARPPIYRETVQAVSPVLAAAYTQPQSTIPTYLGQGRASDGLGLHRPKAAGPYPVCRENAALALRRLEQLGHPPARVAAVLGVPSEAELLAALAALPDYDTAVAASLAAPRPSSRPAADGGATAEPPAERKETAKDAATPAHRETAKEREQREWAETQARIRADVRLQDAEPMEEPDEPDEQVKLLMAELETDEE